MLGRIVVPSTLQIDSWESIAEPPIVETAPRVVPSPVFIAPSTEGFYNRYVSIKAGVLGSAQIRKIREIDDNISLTEDFIKECYSRRPVGRPLLNYIEDIKKSSGSKETPEAFRTPEAGRIAKSMLTPLIDIFRSIRANAEQLTEWFLAEFQTISFWEEGKYSDTYLLRLCMLIYKIITIENLIPYKPGLIDDVSTLLKFINDAAFASEITALRTWMMNFGSNTNLIYEKLMQLPYYNVQTIFDIIFNFVHDYIINKKYIEAETKFSLISALIFIIQWYDKASKKEQRELSKVKKPKPVLKPFPLNVRLFARDIYSVHKTLVLCFEIAPELSQFFPSGFLNFSKKEAAIAPELIQVSEQDLLDTARDTFAKVSHIVADVVSSEKGKNDDTLAKILPETFRKIGETLAFLSEKLEQRRLEKPYKMPEGNMDSAQQAIYQYEFQMKEGLFDILDRFLPLLMTCRTTKEVVTDNIDPILRQINSYMQEYIQEFCVNKIPILINKRPELKDPLMSLRALLGYFENRDSFDVTKKTKEVKNLKYPSGTPNIQLLELARVQLQLIANPGSDFTRKRGVFSGAILNDDDIAMIKKFVDDTYFFIDLLRLPEVIETTCDQSRLFFKEHWLDICKVSFFKITTSLPYILSNFALQNYHQTELTGSIFYPLSIYDDAANTALHYLKSSLLYKEIKAEAEICLVSITRLIADQSFHPIRSFIALRSLSQSICDDLAKEGVTSPHSQNSPAVRLGVLLQQNQLFVLGCPIDTKSLIAQRLDELFSKALNNILDLIKLHGLLVMIAVTKLIDLLRNTHAMMMSFGIPITPFKDIMSIVFSLDTPNSHQNQIIISIASYITGPMLSDFYLLTTPNRLIPKIQPTIPIHALFRKQDGSVLERILRPTATCITIENFRELFDLLDEGSISLLHMSLMSQLSDIFVEFVSVYTKIRNIVKRIKDAPLSSSCYQVFDRFFGAYRNFLGSPDINEVFEIMSEIGLIFSISEMMDNALILKSTSKELMSTYLFSHSPMDEKNQLNENLFEIFDDTFKSNDPHFESLKRISTGNEKLPPFLYATVQQFAQLVQQTNVFEEESEDLIDFQSMNGFAAIWSVLEFLFSMIEVGAHSSNEQGSLIKYGESVLNSAAIILSIVGQADLFSVLSIGERIKSHANADFAVSSDERLKLYLKVNSLVTSSLRCSITTMHPFIDQLYNQ